MSNYSWYTLLDGDNNTFTNTFVKDNLNNIFISGYSDSKIINIGDKTYSRNSDSDAGYILKLDLYGNPVWFHWIDGALSESGTSLSIDSNNNIYLVGYSNSDQVIIKGVSYNKNNTTNGGFIIKFNQSGNVVWFKWLDGANSDYGYSSVIDTTNNIYIVGVSNSISINGQTTKSTTTGAAGFLIKMNVDGSLVWFKWIDGPKFDDSYSIVLDSENNIYISGNSSSSSIKVNNNEYKRDNNNQSVYLIKLDSAGNDKWCLWISGDNQDFISSLACDKFNYIYLCGVSNSKTISINDTGYTRMNNNELYTSFIIKVNSTLKTVEQPMVEQPMVEQPMVEQPMVEQPMVEQPMVEWFKWIEGDQEVESYSIITDNRNNLYMSGSTQSINLTIDDVRYSNLSENNNAYLIKINSIGEIEWTKWLYTTDRSNDESYYYPSILVSNLYVDNNNNLYINGYSNAHNLYFNDESAYLKETETDATFLIKYDLNYLTLSEYIKSCKYVSNKKYIIYKSLFYLLLFIVYVYAIWLLYINKII